MTSSRIVFIPFSSPISILTDDTLWLIFMLNARNYIPDNQSYVVCAVSEPLQLDTARRCSQVCRKWRHILLGTSSIWARLIDWRSLNQESDNWRNEVLRRSGSSRLWIEGYLQGSDDKRYGEIKESTLEFFNRLLDNYWARVQRLSLSLTLNQQIDLFTNGTDPTGREAPNLEIFISSNSTSESFHLEGHMFSGHAPRLRIFHAGAIYCDLDSSWMSNIRDLLLGPCFNNEEVCDALLHLPRLEVLAFQNHTIVDGYCSPPVCLPNLRVLRIHGSIFYLRDIEPAPGTTLYLSLREEDISNINILIPYANPIIKLLRSYVYFHSLRQVSLQCKNKFVFIDGKLYWPKHFETSSPHFVIHLAPEPEMYEDIAEYALEMFPSAYISMITHLILMDCPDVLQSRIGQAFRRFTMQFRNMTHLILAEEAVPALHQLQGEITSGQDIIFPKLTTLVFNGTLGNENGSTENSSWQNYLRTFLLSRCELGAPVATLDFTEVHQIWGDLDFLEEFVGMKVNWGRDGSVVEYECGNGDPDLLRFSPIHFPI